MELSRRQRVAFESVADTFAPGLDGLPSASALGVTEAFVGVLDRHPREAEVREVLQLLSVWDHAARPLRRFSRLPLAERESVLRSWRDSSLERKRSAYKVLRKAVLHHYFGLPGEPRSAIGYPGPLEHAPAPPPFEPERPTGELSVTCDVCVVGSGAGGGTAAGVLAAAGLDVVVLEAGEVPTFTGEEIDSLRRLYLEGAAAATEDQALDFLAGWCLGGGTTVNWTTSLRPPDDVRAEWAAHGVPAFVGDEFNRSLDAVEQRMDVNGEHGNASGRDRVLEQGAEALGWHVAAQPRNVRGCDQNGVCGYCGFGCPLGAKQGTAETWLADAVAAGARVLVGTHAQRVIVERGAAVGVDAGPVQVRARAVVVACGAFQTHRAPAAIGAHQRVDRPQPALPSRHARRRRVR